jgi:serine protease
VSRTYFYSLIALGLMLAGCNVTPQTSETPASPLVVGASMASDDADVRVDRIIVKFKPVSQGVLVNGLTPQRVTAIVRETLGNGVRLRRAINRDTYVLDLPAAMPLSVAKETLARLEARPDVVYAEPDLKMQIQAVSTDDPLFDIQWNLFDVAYWVGATNVSNAWDITTGSTDTVVAVIDTGILPHPDLRGRVLPGYNFISDPDMANNGVGRSADATDLGDWLSQSDLDGRFKGCNDNKPKDSSWHGTHVSGIIGANANDKYGIAGINWKAKILPVRALGKCGGYSSDIADGMRWAAGLQVDGVPMNPYPARIINMSLGGKGACSKTYQSAIDAVTARGTLVVVAAGNENDDASKYTPASCTGVITVASNTRTGAKASYSNFGTRVDLAAPGGSQGGLIVSDGDFGKTTALNDGAMMSRQGTSQATPHVAGIASLMLAVNPSLTPAQITTLLKSTARPFPTGVAGACTTSTCGAGLVDAAAAVAAAKKLAPVQIAFQNGYWWNAAEGGRGYSIERNGDAVFFAGYMYDPSGSAAWYYATIRRVNGGNTFTGDLMRAGGGQPFGEDFRPISSNVVVGTLSITFSSASTAMLSVTGPNVTPFSVAIERFPITDGGLTAPVDANWPQAGFYWNPQEGGTGYVVEIQDGQMFLAVYTYDRSGQPLWYVSLGSMSTARLYRGSLLQYSGGQTLGGAFRPPAVPVSVGDITLNFTSATTAIATLPNGRTVNLQRFTFN